MSRRADGFLTSPEPPHVPLKTPLFSACSPSSLSHEYLESSIRSPAMLEYSLDANSRCSQQDTKLFLPTDKSVEAIRRLGHDEAL